MKRITICALAVSAMLFSAPAAVRAQTNAQGSFLPASVTVTAGDYFDIKYGLRNWPTGFNFDTWELYWSWDSTKVQLIGCTVTNSAPHTCGTSGDISPWVCPSFGFACNEARISSGACCGSGCHFTGIGDLVTVHMRALPGASGTSVIMPADIDHRIRWSAFFLAGNSVPCFNGCDDFSGTTVTVNPSQPSEGGGGGGCPPNVYCESGAPKPIVTLHGPLSYYDLQGRKLSGAPTVRGVYWSRAAGSQIKTLVVVK